MLQLAMGNSNLILGRFFFLSYLSFSEFLKALQISLKVPICIFSVKVFFQENKQHISPFFNDRLWFVIGSFFAYTELPHKG